MTRVHEALIRWSAEQRDRSLPRTTRSVDPAWFDDDGAFDGGPSGGEGWSLACEFDSAPSEQGNPSRVRVRFLVAEAPHDRLLPGARLWMFERATGRYAAVDLID